MCVTIQLKMKEKQIKDILRKLGNALAHQNPELQKWWEEQKTLHEGLPCNLETTRYSKENEG